MWKPTIESPELKQELKLLHEKVYLQLKNWIVRLKNEGKKTAEECDKLLEDLEKSYKGN